MFIMCGRVFDFEDFKQFQPISTIHFLCMSFELCMRNEAFLIGLFTLIFLFIQ